MKRNKTKKTPRGRTIIKKLKDNTVLLPGGGRYKVGERICFSGQGITPIKRKGKVGKVGYSIDDVPDLKDWKPEVGDVGQGMPEVGEVGQIGFGVGEYSGWKTYTYLPVGDYREEPEPPSAWVSWCKLLAGYARELWDALRWFVALPFRSLPDVAAPTPAPAADTPAPADVPPAEPLAVAPIKDEPGSPFAPHPVKLKTKPFPPIGSPARPKRKPRRRKD